MKKLIIPAAFLLAFVLMAAGFLLHMSSGGGAFGPGVALTEQEQLLLKQVVAHPFADGGYNVVIPQTSVEPLWGNDATSTETKKKMIVTAFGDKGYAVSPLVERLYQRNSSPARLPLESMQSNGYIVDDGTYAAYFNPGGGGWGKLHEEHPKSHNLMEYSLPVYDEQSGLFMVYIGSHGGPLAGQGGVALFKYENGALREAGFVRLWIS